MFGTVHTEPSTFGHTPYVPELTPGHGAFGEIASSVAQVSPGLHGSQYVCRTLVPESVAEASDDVPASGVGAPPSVAATQFAPPGTPPDWYQS